MEATCQEQKTEPIRHGTDSQFRRLLEVIPAAAYTRLAQVFANLPNNAAKYNEPHGHIRLTVEPLGGDVVVKVRDNGLGISPHRTSRELTAPASKLEDTNDSIQTREEQLTALANGLRNCLSVVASSSD